MANLSLPGMKKLFAAHWRHPAPKLWSLSIILKSPLGVINTFCACLSHWPEMKSNKAALIIFLEPTIRRVSCTTFVLDGGLTSSPLRNTTSSGALLVILSKLTPDAFSMNKTSPSNFSPDAG